MSEALPFVERYGYWVLAGVGFAEFAGVPIVSVPVLVTAGALSAGPGLHPVPAVLVAALGGLTADLIWYGLGRWRGRRLVDAACRLTSSPGSCVLGVENRLRELGPRLILPSKFLPGVANLMAPAAGFAGVGRARFVVLDASALLAWASVYTGLGYLFSRHVVEAVSWVARFRDAAIPVALGLVVAAGVWRLGGRSHPHPAWAADAEAGDAGGLPGGDAARPGPGERPSGTGPEDGAPGRDDDPPEE